MRNRLDSFFKNKLDSQEFPFDESAWETISGELDKKDKDKKRPFYLWWATGLVAVLAISFSAFFVYDFEKVSLNEYSNNQEKEINSPIKKPIQSIVKEIPNKFVSTIPVEQEIVSTAVLISPSSNVENIGVKEIEYSTEKSLKKKTDFTKPEIKEKAIASIVSENKSPKALSDLQGIDAKFIELNISETSEIPSISPIKRISKRPLKIGLILKGGLSSNNFDSNVLGGGFFISKQISSRFSLSSGINYIHLSGEFEPIQNTTQKSYSFGSTTITNELTPNSIGILEVPLSLGYTIGKNQINLGASANYLVGVFGVKEVFESNLALPRISTEKGRILNSELPKLNVSLNLSVERNWRNLSYGLAGKYYQKNYFQKDDGVKKDLMMLEGFIKYRLF